MTPPDPAAAAADTVKATTTGKPEGTLIDVAIEKVYLWEIEDLKTRFPSCHVKNRMKNIRSAHQKNPYFFPNHVKRQSMIRTTAEEEEEATKITDYDSPIVDDESEESGGCDYSQYMSPHTCILGDIVRTPHQAPYTRAYVRAGPSEYLHFDPDHQEEMNAAIVTCGGLCPGLNNVIREIVNTLCTAYGISGTVWGIRGGYHGFYDFKNYHPVVLTPQLVANIHHEGGTVLGSSRGGFDLDKILTFLEKKKISTLFVIGGDGTHRGAFKIHEGCMAKGLNVAVAGIPKTIDNDIDHIDRSFGFESAVEAAQAAIRSAKTEAICNMPNGVGIVKLMGRSAGYIAAHSTMASGDVDLCLLPEVPLVLKGPQGCLPHIRRRVKEQGYAVIIVAEGAGEDVLGVSAEKDASGNKKLPPIGNFLKSQVEEYFHEQKDVATVKYIDPSYTIRSVMANASDSYYCMRLGQYAVHGAMAGYTGFSVGLCNNRMVFLPIPKLVATSPRSMNPHGRTWERILAQTRQPNTVVAKEH